MIFVDDYSEHSSEHPLFPGTGRRVTWKRNGIYQPSADHSFGKNTQFHLRLIQANQSHTQPPYSTKTIVLKSYWQQKRPPRCP